MGLSVSHRASKGVCGAGLFTHLDHCVLLLVIFSQTVDTLSLWKQADLYVCFGGLAKGFLRFLSKRPLLRAKAAMLGLFPRTPDGEVSNLSLERQFQPQIPDPRAGGRCQIGEMILWCQHAGLCRREAQRNPGSLLRRAFPDSAQWLSVELGGRFMNILLQVSVDVY